MSHLCLAFFCYLFFVPLSSRSTRHSAASCASSASRWPLSRRATTRRESRRTEGEGANGVFDWLVGCCEEAVEYLVFDPLRQVVASPRPFFSYHSTRLTFLAEARKRRNEEQKGRGLHREDLLSTTPCSVHPVQRRCVAFDIVFGTNRYAWVHGISVSRANGLLPVASLDIVCMVCHLFANAELFCSFAHPTLVNANPWICCVLCCAVLPLFLLFFLLLFGAVKSNPTKSDRNSIAIEAAIVRIMKARKAIGHPQLVAEVLSQLSFFRPNPKVSEHFLTQHQGVVQEDR